MSAPLDCRGNYIQPHIYCACVVIITVLFDFKLLTLTDTYWWFEISIR